MSPTTDSPFLQQRAREERNRLLAYCERLTLELPLTGGRRFPFPLVVLRWHHVLALLRSGNAFFTALEPRPGDFLELLWLLHPHHPANRALAARSPFAHRPSPFTAPVYAWLSRLVLHAAAAQLQLAPAEKILRLHLRDAFQDREGSPRDPDAPEPGPLEPTVTDFDLVSARFAAAGYTRERFLAAPVAWTLQVLRVEGLRDPRRRDHFIPPSASLLRLDEETTDPASP